MALVSYGSSDESDYSDEDDENEPKIVINNSKTEPKPSIPKPAEKISAKLPAPNIKLNSKIHLQGPAGPDRSKARVDDDIDISDEEDDHIANYDPGLLDEQEPDLISIISAKLPNAKPQEKANLLDLNEDLSTIPAKKDYGQKPELPPTKKKSNGPVKITIPSLADLKNEDDEESPPKKKLKQSEKGSGLFALLPDPKNKAPQKKNVLLVPNSVVTKKPNIPTDGPNHFIKNNLKPSGVRSVGMVPHRVANPVKKTPVVNSDSDSDDDLLGVGGVSNSYFPEPRKPHPSSTPGSTLHLPRVNTAPQDVGAANHRPLSFRPGFNKPKAPRPPPTQAALESNFLSLDASSDYDHGPATAPYPPTDPGPSGAVQAGIDNEDALRKLAGKQNRLKEEKFDIIDINEDDMKGDPRTWLTKAMTEEEAPRPSGTGPKGLAKSRHQITYLAHMAKEREWELKQEWSTAAHNRRASANKYGFI